MNQSESIANLAAALCAFHKEVGKIRKEASNPFFKNKYASLSNILETVTPALANNGLSVIQMPENDYLLITRLLHVSGEFIESSYSMKPVKDDPQGRGSAITYQRRYAIGAILSLNIDDDDDGNQASQPQANGVKIEKKVTIKEAEKQNEDIKDCIKSLLDCHSVYDLQMFKQEIPKHVIHSASFVEAAKQRYNELNNVPA